APQTIRSVEARVLGGLPRIKRPVALRVDVEPDDEAMREPGPGVVLRRDTRRGAVVVGVILDVVPQRARREAKATRRGNVAQPAPHQVAERIRVDLAGLREADAVANVPETALEPELGVGLDVHVGPAG